MGQVHRKYVMTLRISYNNFERLTGYAPEEIHLLSQKKKNAILIKSLSHSDLVYNAQWQDLEVKKMESLQDFIHNFILEQFEFHPEPITEAKKLFNLHFIIPAKRNNVIRFLQWFRSFMLKKKIPLEKESGFRAFINIDKGMLTKEELRELRCWQLTESTYAVIYSFKVHDENLRKWAQASKEKELLEMKREKEKMKKNQEDWDAETEAFTKKSEKDALKEKRSKMHEKLTSKRKRNNEISKSEETPKKSRKLRKDTNSSETSKKASKVKEKVDILDVAVKKVKTFLKENLGESVMTLSEKDVLKVFKDAPKGLMKGLAKAIEEKYSVLSTKSDDGIILTIWKKAKKIPAKALKAD